jgi:hypothetical protein
MVGLAVRRVRHGTQLSRQLYLAVWAVRHPHPPVGSSPLADPAERRGHQLVASPKTKAGPGRGQHPQSPYRLRGLALPGTAFGRALYRSRAAVERWFGRLTAAGFGTLPPWVRRLHHVKRWVQLQLFVSPSKTPAPLHMRPRCIILPEAGKRGEDRMRRIDWPAICSCVPGPRSLGVNRRTP